jgi:sugar phosphate isomerase/epimerase
MPNMPSSQIACQMYTLRDFTKTPADIAVTLKRVKKIGYDAIQVSAFGPIDAKELSSILKGEGLTCCATHIPMDRMRDQTQQVIDDHKLWGCKYTAIGGFFPKLPKTEDWYTFAEQFSAVAQKFEGSGLSIGYHNHSHELGKFDGKLALQILLEKLSPKIWFEIDTYWIAHGGCDPIDWINKVKGRIPCVHLKDMGIDIERKQVMREVGEGNLNWPGILGACRNAGVEWYIVEQDNCNGKDPFECVATSLRNLRGMGVQ